jgi:uncharacterized protein YoxC
MSVEHVAPVLAPFFIVPMLLSILISIAALVAGVYLLVCVHQIKNATQEMARELREIRKYLQDDKRTE